MAGVSNIAKPQTLGESNGTDYVLAWHRFMKAESLLEELDSLGPDIEVYSRRLLGVEWARGGDWESRMHLIMGNGSAESKLLRLFSSAKNNPKCANNNGRRGWKLLGRPS